MHFCAGFILYVDEEAFVDYLLSVYHELNALRYMKVWSKIRRIDRQQIVPKERYKPKAVQIREITLLAQEIQEGFMKEAVE